MSLVFDDSLLRIFTLSGEEITKVDRKSDGLVLWERLIGQYIIEDGVLNASLASGNFRVYSVYQGSKSGGTTTATFTIADKLVGKTLIMTFRGYVDGYCHSGQNSRYAYVECGGTRIETIDMLIKGDGQNKTFDKTIMIEFVPTSTTITIGVHLGRTANSSQSTQQDKQGAEIIDLKVDLPGDGTPYHVPFTSYPLTKTDSGIDKGTGTVSTTSSGYSMSVSRNTSALGAGFVKASVILPTQRCSKVKITYSGTQVSTFIVNNSAVIPYYVSSVNNSTYIFYTSGDTLQLDLELYDSADNLKATIQITDIYFYN